MYDNSQIIAFARSTKDLDLLAERFISGLLAQKPHARSQGNFIKYTRVDGAAFSFDAFAHLTTVRFKLRHAIFNNGQSKSLVGEFDWYFLDSNGEFALQGHGIQLIPEAYVSLPNGKGFELYSQTDESEYEQLEIAISLLVMHELQSRMVEIKQY